MVILHIEHPVPDFDAWRRAFDADPLDRGGSGVRRYRVMRSLDDPAVVIVNLELGSREEAEAMREALLRLWGRAQAEGLIGESRASVAEILETTDL